MFKIAFWKATILDFIVNNNSLCSYNHFSWIHHTLKQMSLVQRSIFMTTRCKDRYMTECQVFCTEAIVKILGANLENG